MPRQKANISSPGKNADKPEASVTNAAGDAGSGGDTRGHSPTGRAAQPGQVAGHFHGCAWGHRDPRETTGVPNPPRSAFHQ